MTEPIVADANKSEVVHQGYNDLGTAQQLRKIGTDFHLNPRFVEDVGRAKAQQLCDVLTEVGTRMAHRPRRQVQDELATALQDIDVRMAPPELDSMADEISRSDWVKAHMDKQRR